MRPKGLKGDIGGAVNTVLIVLVGILMVSASSVVILVYDSGQKAESPEIEQARWGDTVRVDYVGKLADGRVFDTSLWAVASNDAMYPKSLAFNLRNESMYTPLEFRIGAGQMIRGFELGVIGMDVNETRVLDIPPDEGYGPMNMSKIVEIPYIQTVPVFEYMSLTQYFEKFAVQPQSGLTLPDPMWGWDVTVHSVDEDADLVITESFPVLGADYPVYGANLGLPNTGWYITVESYDSSVNDGKGEITIRNLLQPDDGGYVKGMDSWANEFIVQEVDPDSNIIVLNYNGELVGVTLYFTVTLVEIV